MAYNRRTSIDAYNEVKRSGLLGKRQKHAYAVLFEYGPLTGNELSEKMGIPGQWKRCSELKKRGLALEVGERECRVTGRRCIVWDVTNNPPRKPDQEIKESARQKIERLEQESQELRDLLAWPVALIEHQAKKHVKISEEGIKWYEKTKKNLESEGSG